MIDSIQLQVVEKIEIYNISTKEKSCKFRVQFVANNGSIKEEKNIETLDPVEVSKNFKCHALKHEDLKKMLNASAVDCPTRKKLICPQGFSELGDVKIFAMGNQTYCSSSDYVVDAENGYKLKAYNNIEHENCIAMDLKFLNFFPELSPIIFFATMFSVVKSMLPVSEEYTDFVFCIKGKRRHYKTSTIKKISLHAEQDRELQIFNFSDIRRVSDLKKYMKDFSGANILIDDLPRYNDSQKSNRTMDKMREILHLSSLSKGAANIFLTTEELDLKRIRASDLERMFMIYVPEKSDDELDLLCERAKKLPYGYMSQRTYQFSKCLIDHYDAVVEEIEKYRNSYSCDSSRVAQQHFYLLLTQHLYMKYLLKDENGIECSNALLSALDVNKRIFEKQLSLVDKIENIDYVQAVIDLPNKWADAKCIDTSVYEANATSFLYEKGCLWITRDALQRGLCETLGFTVNINVVRKVLSEAGVLLTDNEKYQKKKCGVWHYVIPKYAADNYLRNKKDLGL